MRNNACAGSTSTKKQAKYANEARESSTKKKKDPQEGGRTHEYETPIHPLLRDEHEHTLVANRAEKQWCFSEIMAWSDRRQSREKSEEGWRIHTGVPPDDLVFAFIFQSHSARQVCFVVTLVSSTCSVKIHGRSVERARVATAVVLNGVGLS